MATSRRSFVRSAALAGGGAALGHAPWLPAQAFQAQDPARTGIPGPVTVPAGLPTLREAAEQRGLLVGTAVAAQPLRRDPAYGALVKQQANLVVAENAMKFGPMRPGPNKFFFDDADALFAFADANGIRVRGHNFVWHRQLPAWFNGYATRENAASLLTNHIETVGGRYAGRMHSWDVVNEAIHLEDKQPGGLRDAPWYRLLGPEYIDMAFRAARKVDPKALLCYNDYGIESEAPDNAAKRSAVLELLRGMQRRGVPLDAVGVQSHIAAGGNHVYGPGLEQFLQEVHRMGLQVLLTEMDVNDRALPADPAKRDEAVAATYASYLKTTLAQPGVTGLLTWGITDRYTWLNGEDSRADKQPERALPFDRDLRPKAAYVAEVEAIRAAPRG
jgi:endo-1,4-beta-xylanase